MLRRFRGRSCGLALLLCASSAWGHAMRSAYVEINELAGNQIAVQVRKSVPCSTLRLKTPEGCSAEQVYSGDDGLEEAFAWTCPTGLVEQTLEVDGLGPVLTEAVVDIAFADGRTASHLFRESASRWQIPGAQTALSIAREYLRLGVVHIMTGPDHLLFLFLLVLALKRPRAVLVAESAFTVSHSLTFSAAALGWLQVSSQAAEACIALSLVLLALDIGKPGVEASAWRGAGMALVFGLVHGLGFAGGLREIGLPEQSIPLALVSFGLGVEVGQIAFLVAMLGVVHLLTRSMQWPRISLGATYAAGSVSTYWLLQRLWVCFA